MKVQGQHYRTIWRGKDGSVEIIDQTRLPHEFSGLRLKTVDDCVTAIRTMQVRGAPLIGATAAYGMGLALKVNANYQSLAAAYDALLATRPTAINLRWALERVRMVCRRVGMEERAEAAFTEAAAICEDDVATNRAIGEHGLKIIQEAATKKTDGPKRVNILTHCNAGWLACVDYGTALSPIYMAHDAGIPVHVWVDETRPRNQGASLTAWELAQHGVPHTVIADNAGGHLMQHGLVDLCIVGTDRTTKTGDVCNKIGTYLKALAAKDNNVPFYVALPHSTIDWTLADGVADIPIEERTPQEVTHITGLGADGKAATVQLTPNGTNALNYGFDVTPARLVTALITERGTCPASTEGLLELYPDKRGFAAA